MKFFADVITVFSVLMESISLANRCSITLSVKGATVLSSEEFWRTYVTDLIAELALGGSLKERVAENRMPASFLLDISSLFRRHLFFSSQT